MNVLHTPVRWYGLALLGVIAALGGIVTGVIALVMWILEKPQPGLFYLLFNMTWIIVVFSIVWRSLFRRFFRVPPSASYGLDRDFGPWLSCEMDPKSAIRVSWYTREISPSQIHIGLSPTDLRIVTGKPGTIHHVIVSDLQPATSYYYRLVPPQPTAPLSALYQFRTAPIEGSQCKFIVFGDSQNGGGLGLPDWGLPSMLSAMKTYPIDLLVVTGDICDQGNDLRSWSTTLDYISSIACQVPLHVAVGNHDTGTHYMHDKALKKYPDEGANFDYLLDYDYQIPPDEDEITSFRGRYFAFTYGKCAFIFLDTQNSKMAEPLNPQWAWLRSWLAKIPSDYWKFAFVHRDLVSVQGKENHAAEDYDKFAKYMLPLLIEGGVHLLFQGHVHHYNHFHWTYDAQVPFFGAQGVSTPGSLYVVTTGGAGDEFRKNPPSLNLETQRWGQVYQEDSTHFVTVRVDGDSCHIQARYADDKPFPHLTIHKK